MAKIKILSPPKNQLRETKRLLPVRFEYRGKIYETYEPYFLIALMAKRENMSIQDLLLKELRKGRKLNKKLQNAK
jgi:hypothetical protein